MPKPLPKNLGGLGSRFWKQIKQQSKLKKDEDLEKQLVKLEEKLAALSKPPTEQECYSIKNHLMKADVAATKVMKTSKVKEIVAFCDAVSEQFARYVAAFTEEQADAVARSNRDAGTEISADIFSLTKSKFPENKAVKAFATGKEFTLLALDGKKPVRFQQLAAFQSTVKPNLGILKNSYLALAKVPKKKTSLDKKVQEIQAIYDKIYDALAMQTGGIAGQITEWLVEVRDIYTRANCESEFAKFQKSPVWKIATLAAAAAKKEFDDVVCNQGLVYKL
jgi:hypothetical protein